MSLAHGVIVVLQDRQALAGPSRGCRVRACSFDREALGERGAAAVGVLHGRSDQSRLELDCDATQYWVLVERIYSGNALTGSSQAVTTGVGPQTPYPGANIPFVMHAGCDAAYSPPLGAAAGEADQAYAPMPTPPSPPPETSPSRPRPYAARSACAAHGRPRRASSRAAKSSRVVRAHPATPSRCGPTGDEPEATIRERILVHIFASDSEAIARKSLSDAARLLAPEAARQSRSAFRGGASSSNGKTLYRASLGGFSSRPQAMGFCMRLQAVGGQCWVR